MVNNKAALKLELLDRCKKYKADNWEPRVNQAIEYVWGDQNIRKMGDDEQNDFVVNISYKFFNILQSQYCRNVPSVMIRPMMSDFEAERDEVTKRITQNWHSNEMPLRLIELTSQKIPAGVAFYKVTWDKEMRMGLGDMRIEVPDSRNIFFMPGVGSVRKSLIMYERKILDKLSILHMFPEQKEEIEQLFRIGGDVPYSKEGKFTGGGQIQYATTPGGSTYSWSDSSAGRADEHPVIELIEEWSIDPTVLKQVPELFERIEKTQRYKAMPSDKQYQVANQKMYPRGRLCVFAGSHEFASGPNPFPSFPYIQCAGNQIPQARPGDEYGMGDIDQVLEIQDLFNTNVNQMADALDHTAMGGFGVSDGCIDKDEFTSKPRRIYSKNRPGEFEWYNPASIPSEAFAYSSMIRGMGDDVLNVHGILSSGDTKDVRSGQGVSELTELANRVLISGTYSLEACHRSLVRYQIHMMGSPFYQRGIHYSDHVDLSGILPDMFDISITAGLNLPMSKQSSQSTLFRLRELEAIDNEALIDSVDISVLPDKEEIKARMRGKELAAQQMANQQAEAEVNERNASAQGMVQEQQMNNVVPIGA